MQPGWILHPFTIYAFVGLGLIASLVLFVSAKMETQVVRREAEAARTRLEAEIESLVKGLEGLREAVQNAVPVPVATGPGLNLTRRAQALRMSRRGEPAASIAAALQMPRNEIELMLKVNGLLDAPAVADR
jgi:hypothetical protein